MGTTAPPATAKTPFFIHRDFALLWGGQSISVLGDWIFDTTLTLWVATIIARGQPWAPLAMSGVVLAASLVSFLVGPLAGVFVDRWDKRQTLLWMDAARAVLIALLLLAAFPLPFLPGMRLPTIWQLALIYLVTLLTSVCAQFFNPARFILIRDVVSEPQRARATGLGMLSGQAARIIGPPLAAPLLFGFGIQWALIINALSFVVSFLAIWLVRAPSSSTLVSTTPRSSLWSEFTTGLRFFLHSRLLLTLLVVALLLAVVTAAEDVLGVFFVTQNLHMPTQLYGIVGMVAGGGSILAVLVVTASIQRLGVVRSFWGGMLLTGLLFSLFARLTNFLPALVVLFLAMFPMAATNIALTPLMLHVIPRELAGRLSSVFSSCVSVVALLSVGLVGALASLLHAFHATWLGMSFGPFDTILTGAGLFSILAGIYALINLHHVRIQAQEA